MSNQRVAKPSSRFGSRVRWWCAGLMLASTAVAIAFGVRGRGGSDQGDWAAIEAAIAGKRWGEAERRLSRWLGGAPGDGKALLRLGAVLAVQGRDDEAEAALLRVAPADPARPQARARLAEYWLQEGRLREAEGALRDAIAGGSRAIGPRHRLVYVLTTAQRPDEARAVLWDLYRRTDDPRHLATMAGLSAAVPDARDRDPELDRFLRRTPDDPMVRRAQGLRLLALGRPDEARPYLESSARAFDDDPAGRLALAECRLSVGDPAGVAEALGPEPERPADRARWWVLTGQAAELAGRDDEAITCWRQAVAQDPGSRAAHYRLGQALARRGKSTEAKAHLDRAEELRLDQVNLILALDRYLRGGADADLTERLGALCRDLGLLPEARGWYEQTIRLDPTRRPPQLALAGLAAVDGPLVPPPLRPRPTAEPASPAGAAPPLRTGAVAARPRFMDIAPGCGVDFRYDSGATGDLFIGDTMGGGVALFDADGDGALDIYFVNGCPLPVDPGHPPAPNKLYRNRGDGTFEDVTARAGVGGRGYGMGCAVGDYDDDGDDDLFVTGLGSTVLYRNRGDGVFEDVTARAGVASARWTTAAAFADFDGDGDLDLAVAAYVRADPRAVVHCKDTLGHPIHCPPGHYPPEPDHLFRNDGDGTFTDVAREAGLDRGEGPGLGLAAADFDGDGRLDLFVANDATPNFFYRNLGGLKFREDGAAAGVAYDGTGRATASMGVVADDLDDDGLIDLLHTNFVNESVTLLKNRGGGQFADVTGPAGLAAPTREVTGFGAVGFDADNDGDVDLFFANGHVDDRPWDGRLMAQRPQLFVNRGRGRFEPHPAAAPYFAAEVVGRGAAAGDLNNDGRVDLVVVHRDARAAVLMNRTGAGHWLGLRLRGPRPGRTPVGARVTCRAGGRSATRWVTAGTSYLAASDPRVWFGLGDAIAVDRLEVRWPSGRVQSWPDLPADRLLDIEEGSDPSAGRPKPGAAPGRLVRQ